MKAVHFGAGSIGRGFIGQVLHESGYEILFVDPDEKIVSQINRNQKYEIELIDQMKTKIFIDKVSAVNSITDENRIIKELVDADIITTSVGVSNLKKIAPILTEALLKRNRPINVLANENYINASDLLKKEIIQNLTPDRLNQIKKNVHFVNTAIDRLSLTLNEGEELIAVVEPYYEWVIDQSELSEVGFYMKNVTLVSNLMPFIQRKLFLVNASHAAFAYLGYLFNYETVQEAALDIRIMNLVKLFLNENKCYFVHQYKMDEEALDIFIEQVILRQTNPLMSDSVSRVGGSPLRKLGLYDRIVGPVLSLEKLGLRNITGIKIISSALLFYNSQDQESITLRAMITEKGIHQTIQEVTKIEDTNLIDQIVYWYCEISKDKNNIFSN